MAGTGKTAGDSKNYCSAKEIADLFGVGVRRIQQLTQDGVLVTVETKSGRRYEMAPTVRRYINYLSNKAYGRTQKVTEMELKEQKLRAEVALKESQGELHRLRTEIAAGKYISVEEVKLDYSRFFVSLKRFAMSIPSRLAGRLAGFADPVEVRQLENELHNEVQRLLNNFVLKFSVDEGGRADGRP